MVLEKQATEFSVANAQLKKTLMEVCSHETELEAEVASLQDDFLTAHSREVALYSLLDKERKVNEERLAQLETIADDSIISAYAELMQEFKDEKSGEWNSDY